MSGAGSHAPAVKRASGAPFGSESAGAVADRRDAYTWTAPAWFCGPWTPAFGLLGAEPANALPRLIHIAAAKLAVSE